MSGKGAITRADWIVAAGAVALAASLFLLDWYGGDIVGLMPKTRIAGAGFSSTGWEAFAHSRWVWLATIALALASLPAASAGLRRRGPVQLSATLLLLGAVSSALIAYRIVHHPGMPVSGANLHVAYDVEAGIWIGLAAALAIVAGSGLRLYEESPRALGQGSSRLPRQALTALRTLAERFGRRRGEGAREEAPGEQPEGERSQPAFSGLTVRGSQQRAGERRPGRAP
jgi:hypothetical protein